jgi:hypothetical protein
MAAKQVWRLGARCLVVDRAVVDNDSSSLYKHLQKSRIFYLFHPLTVCFFLYIKIISLVFPIKIISIGINLNFDFRSSKMLAS